MENQTLPFLIEDFIATVKTFCLITDVIIPRKKIKRGLPHVERYADDWEPIIEETLKI
ncbi:MAG TPA: hypothetical protein VD694_01790 [Nitrososphaeraceae archaeon]|nr:hypothetical protein [Nitrososphaeraceae archaeon]